MKEFLAYIIKNLVDQPEEVHIKEVGGSNTTIYELTVAQPDMGKIIGKEGRTIKAIRTLLVSVASRNKVKVSLEIIEHNR